MNSLNFFSIALIILVSRCLLQTAETELCKDLHFGYRFTGHQFHKYVGISWENCIENCKRIRQCASVNFIRTSGYCELNDADDTTNSSALQSERGVMYSSKSNWNYVETEKCQSCKVTEMCTEDAGKPCKVIRCPVLSAVPCSKILGNMYDIGARQLCVCENGERLVMICQSNGTWSVPTSEYPYKMPEIRNATYNILENDALGLAANISCHQGFVKLGDDSIRYDVCSKEWIDVRRVECVKLKDEGWTLVYGKLQGFSGQIYRSWIEPYENDGEFRNDEVIKNWTNNTIQQVKIELKDFSGKIVRTLLFNGSNVDKEKWFSFENLINPPWTDLNDKSPDVFSIKGIIGHTETNEAQVRWAILDNDQDANRNATINCTHGRVWFAVTKVKLNPCDNLFKTRGNPYEQVIVFSNSTNGTRWKKEELGFAKTMLVYVL